MRPGPSCSYPAGNAALGWWWADPIAALAILPLVIREGLEGWRAEHEEAASVDV